MTGAQAAGEAVNSLCGDVIRVELTVANGVIERAAFTGDACAVCVASASLLTSASRGQSHAEMRQAPDDQLLALSGARFPDGRRKCATLPGEALRRALGAREAPHPGGVSALLLAAGSATRFGGGKLLAHVGGEPIVRRAALALVGAVDRLIVVTDSANADVMSALAGLPCTIIVNERAHEGMGTSVSAGVAADVDHPDAVMIALADQPLVAPKVVRVVRDTWRASTDRPAIVVPIYGDARGHPVLFDRAMFDELRALNGDRGARDVIDRDPARVRRVPIDAAQPADVDTEQDLTALERDLDARTRSSDG